MKRGYSIASAALALLPLVSVTACGAAEKLPPPPGSASLPTPPPAAQSVPPPIAEETKPPEVIKRVTPDFSKLASKESAGPCLAEIVIGRNGRISSFRNLRPGRAERDRLFEKAVRQWVFRPATRNGEPIEVHFVVTVNHCPV